MQDVRNNTERTIQENNEALKNIVKEIVRRKKDDCVDSEY